MAMSPPAAPASGWSAAAGAHCPKPHDCAAVADRTGPTREPSPGRPFWCLCARRISNRALTRAQKEFCEQLEGSDRSGQALWHPRVAAGSPAPDCVVFLEEIGRFAMAFPTGQFAVEDDDWYRRDADGNTSPVSDLIVETWQAAKSIRMARKRGLGIGAYVIPVVVFADMSPYAGIMEAPQGWGGWVFFGADGVVQRLATLPDEDQLQTHLHGGFIRKEVATLSRSSARGRTPPEQASLGLDDERAVIRHADVVKVHVNAGADGVVSLRDDRDR